MSREELDAMPRGSSETGPIVKLRYVLDFGPQGAKTGSTLKAIDCWLANGSKYSGAIMMRPSTLPATSSEGLVTAVEIEVKAYEIQDPNNDVSKFVLGLSNPAPVEKASGDAMLVLADSTRNMVSDIVRSALGYALGENGRDVILSRLQLDYGFGFSEVTDFPGRFMELLNEILEGGAKYVEDRILQQLVAENPKLAGCRSFKEGVVKLVAIDSLRQK